MTFNVEILFLAPSFASASLETHEKWRERGREREGELTLSKCQNKAENTECFTHTRLYANYIVSRQASVCVCLSLHASVFLCDRARFVQLTVTWSRVGVCLCAQHKLSLCYVSLRMLQMQSVRVCVWRVCGIVSFCKLERHVAG